jgi:hypothetical protein
MVDEPLEDFWAAVRVAQIEVKKEVTFPGPEESFAKAAESFMKEAPALLDSKWRHQDVSAFEVISGMWADMAKLFLTQWLEAQKNTDISLVIQLFLEGPKVPSEDVKGFIRALPLDVLHRIHLRMEAQPDQQRSGLHALLSVEQLFREGVLQDDYELSRDLAGTLVVTMYPAGHSGPLNFRLRELFSR